MEGAFDSIFSALMKSEEIAQIKIQRLKEVKEATENLQLSIEKDRASFKDKVAKREDLEIKLAEAEISLTLNQVMERGLEADLEAKKKELHEENRSLEEVSTSLLRMCQENSDKVVSFSKDYGLTSMGTEKREFDAKERIKTLKKEVEVLFAGVEAMEKRISVSKSSLDARSQLLVKLNETIELTSVEEENIWNQSNRLKFLSQRNKKLTEEPDKSEEFLSLAGKQQQYDIDELQLEAKELQNRLRILTETLKRKEGQVLHSQYRDWQRQRKRENNTSNNSSSNTTTNPTTSSSNNDHDAHLSNNTNSNVRRFNAVEYSQEGAGHCEDNAYVEMAEEDGVLPDFVLLSSNEENVK